MFCLTSSFRTASVSTWRVLGTAVPRALLSRAAKLPSTSPSEAEQKATAPSEAKLKATAPSEAELKAAEFMKSAPVRPTSPYFIFSKNNFAIIQKENSTLKRKELFLHLAEKWKLHPIAEKEAMYADFKEKLRNYHLLREDWLQTLTKEQTAILEKVTSSRKARRHWWMRYQSSEEKKSDDVVKQAST